MPNFSLKVIANGSNTNLYPLPVGAQNFFAITGLPNNYVSKNFVFTSLVSAFDSYSIESVSGTINLSINSVSVEVVAGIVDDAFTSFLSGLLYIGGIDYLKDYASLFRSQGNYSFPFDTNPSTNLKWDIADLATIEAGLSIKFNGGVTTPIDCAVDSSELLFFAIWTSKNITAYNYSTSGKLTFLNNNAPNDISLSIAVDNLNKFIVIGETVGISLYSYDILGNLILLSYVGTGVDLYYIDIDPTKKIVFGGSGANRVNSYTYDSVGIIVLADNIAVSSSVTAIVITTSDSLIFVITNGTSLESLSYDAVGTLANVDSLAIAATGYDVQLDTNLRFVFVLRGNEILSYGYDAAGNFTALIDSISTNLSNARSLQVDSIQKLIIVCDFSGNDLNSFSYDVAGNFSYISSTGGIVSPTISAIDVPNNLFFFGSTNIYNSASYLASGVISVIDSHIHPAAPRAELVYVNVNFSLVGEVVSNVISSDVIHINQSFSVLAEEDMGRYLVGATSVKILYKKPNNTENEVNGVVVDNNRVFATIPAALNNMVGKWLFKLYCILPGGQIIEGKLFFANIVDRWDQ